MFPVSGQLLWILWIKSINVMAFLQYELVLGQMELTCCSKGVQRLWWADMKHEAAGSSFNYFSSFLLSWGQIGMVVWRWWHNMKWREVRRKCKWVINIFWWRWWNLDRWMCAVKGKSEETSILTQFISQRFPPVLSVGVVLAGLYWGKGTKKREQKRRSGEMLCAACFKHCHNGQRRHNLKHAGICMYKVYMQMCGLQRLSFGLSLRWKAGPRKIVRAPQLKRDDDVEIELQKKR